MPLMQAALLSQGSPHPWSQTSWAPRRALPPSCASVSLGCHMQLECGISPRPPVTGLPRSHLGHPSPPSPASPPLAQGASPLWNSHLACGSPVSCPGLQALDLGDCLVFPLQPTSRPLDRTPSPPPIFTDQATSAVTVCLSFLTCKEK